MPRLQPPADARPHIGKLNRELRSFASANWTSVAVLQEILAELLFRQRKLAQELRLAVVERILELQRLQSEAFIWPTTDAPKASDRIEDTDWPRVGVLKVLGYSVGQNGATDEARRSILDYAYNGRLPQVHSAAHMAEWGSPGTGPRLHKMADCLASWCRNAKRNQSGSLEVAIEEWEEDLDYLKYKYYVGRYEPEFPWTEAS